MRSEHAGGTQGDPERTGPVARELIPGAWSPGMSDAGTGPVPIVQPDPRPPGRPDPSPTTAPQPAQRAPRQDAPPPAARPPAAPVPPPRNSARKASRDENVVAFVLHQFPIGHMPVVASHPSRQLPPPNLIGAREHPSAAMISDAKGLAPVRSGHAPARTAPHGEAVPPELTEDYRPFGDLGELEWERMYRSNGSIVWPDRELTTEPEVLAPETTVDHIGTVFGRILVQSDTQFARRSVPPEYLELDYRRYRVLRPTPVWRTVAEPWFGQQGGAVLYRATVAVVELMALGYLLELNREQLAAEATTLRLNTTTGEDGK